MRAGSACRRKAPWWLAVLILHLPGPAKDGEPLRDHAAQGVQRREPVGRGQSCPEFAQGDGVRTAWSARGGAAPCWRSDMVLLRKENPAAVESTGPILPAPK